MRRPPLGEFQPAFYGGAHLAAVALVVHGRQRECFAQRQLDPGATLVPH
jgi:hypothetical protein